MKLEQLCGEHPTYDRELWCRYDALYRGGKDFRKQIGKFLLPNAAEPTDRYEHRKREAYYRSYCGPIVDFFAAQLMAAPMTTRVVDRDSDETVDPDEFYARFKEDVDGVGTDLVDFARNGFRKSLVKGSYWWLASLPSAKGAAPQSKADWIDQDLGRVKLCGVEPETVLDWEFSEDGSLLWAVLFEETRPRTSFSDSRKLSKLTFRVIDELNVSTYVRFYDPNAERLSGDTDVPLVSVVPHGFSRVPLIRIELPEGLWLLNRVHDAQVEHFRLSSGLGWAIRQSCYAQPVFNLVDGEDGKPRAPMGVGYYIQIGKDDKVDYLSPPAQPYQVIAEEIKSQKDEIYRVSQQMAQGVENNAAAVGRSGDSKMADAGATEVCLKAYGSVVREAIEKMFDLVVDGRRDSIKFSISGLDKFNLADAAIMVDNASKVTALNIPSTTFKKELFVSTAEALLPALEQGKKDEIRKEIEEGVDSAKEAEDKSVEIEQRSGEANAALIEQQIQTATQQSN